MKITTLFHKQTGKKIYKRETKSYTAAESETEDLIAAQVNLSGEKNRTEHNVTKSLWRE